MMKTQITTMYRYTRNEDNTAGERGHLRGKKRKKKTKKTNKIKVIYKLQEFLKSYQYILRLAQMTKNEKSFYIRR